MPHAAKPEILAPAGDADCLRAAIENGADAVYFGLKDHNARARYNFDLDELPNVMALLHRRAVRGYVALNTLAFSRELDELELICAYRGWSMRSSAETWLGSLARAMLSDY